MRVITPLAPWLPWIAFLVIAQDTLLRLQVGLVVALLLVIVAAALKLYRGILMWVTLAFFAAMTVAVFGLHSAWAVSHFAVLANGALAAGSWFSLLIGKPFTLDSARQDTDPAHWEDPLFMRVNVVISAVWATVFAVNGVAAWMLMRSPAPRGLSYAIPLATLLGALAFSSWYARRIRRVAQGTGSAAMG